MILYKVLRNHTIVEKEATEITDILVSWTEGLIIKREARECHWWKYFESREEAENYRREKVESRIKKLYQILEQ